MNMTEKEYATPCGTIHYWVSGADLSGPPVVFLPGLTADHRLFEKQIEYFEGKYPLFVWDAPGHAASWPFPQHDRGLLFPQTYVRSFP